MTRRIGILAFDDMEELDALGPYEILAAWTQRHPDDGWGVVLFSASGGPVTCAKGLSVNAQASAADVGPLDVLLHPGGQGTRSLMRDPAHLAWLRGLDVPLLTSVCSGSLVLAAAGLLSGQPATSHHEVLDLLGSVDPTIEVRRDVRYVDAGDVITSAGVSAGIDMSLHLVARLVSAQRAAEVARYVQYDYGEHGIAGAPA